MMQTYTPNQILAVYVMLLCSGYFYDLVVDVLSRHLPARFYRSSIAVVVGTSMTLCVVGFITGPLVTLIYFGAFAMSGLPMIRGDFRRGETVTG
jgi:hypothetical protein